MDCEAERPPLPFLFHYGRGGLSASQFMEEEWKRTPQPRSKWKRSGRGMEEQRLSLAVHGKGTLQSMEEEWKRNERGVEEEWKRNGRVSH